MSDFPFWLHASPVEGPAISASDRGFLLGDGVFDTLVAFGGKPFMATRHRNRLVRAAAFIGIAIDADMVDDAVSRTCSALAGRSAILRTTITRGQSGRGLWPASLNTPGEPPTVPTLLVTTQPWSPEMAGQPVALITASASCNERSALTRLKTLNYLDKILAAREAAEAGADDALILNGQGQVASTTIANLVMLKDGMLLTPPLIDGVLDGIMRGLVLEEAVSVGLQPVERSLTPRDLLASEGVFLTNSVRLLRPVTALDGQPLPASPLTARFQARVFERIKIECGWEP